MAKPCMSCARKETFNRAREVDILDNMLFECIGNKWAGQVENASPEENFIVLLPSRPSNAYDPELNAK